MAISSNVFLVFGIHCNGREGRGRGGEFSRFLFSAPGDYLGHNSKNVLGTTCIFTELNKGKKLKRLHEFEDEPRGLNPPIKFWWLCLYCKLHQPSYPVTQCRAPNVPFTACVCFLTSEGRSEKCERRREKLFVFGSMRTNIIIKWSAPHSSFGPNCELQLEINVLEE